MLTVGSFKPFYFILAFLSTILFSLTVFSDQESRCIKPISITKSYPDELIEAAYHTLRQLKQAHPVAFQAYVKLCGGTQPTSDIGEFLITFPSPIRLVVYAHGGYAADKDMRQLTWALVESNEM